MVELIRIKADRVGHIPLAFIPPKDLDIV